MTKVKWSIVEDDGNIVLVPSDEKRCIYLKDDESVRAFIRDLEELVEESGKKTIRFY